MTVCNSKLYPGDNTGVLSAIPVIRLMCSTRAASMMAELAESFLSIPKLCNKAGDAGVGGSVMVSAEHQLGFFRMTMPCLGCIRLQ